MRAGWLGEGEGCRKWLSTVHTHSLFLTPCPHTLPFTLHAGAEGGLLVMPTYAIIAAHPSNYNIPLRDFVPGVRGEAQALHGEQYVELFGALPSTGTLVTR